MNMIRIIEKKRDNEELTTEEINWMIENYTKGNIEDYQMSAFLMAVVLNGMTNSECVSLTLAMVNSGDTVDLSEINGIKCDKHSTGGVGDKTTLILTPLVASLGVPVAKMSGRGLGHTGGTLDKIESIPKAKIDFSMKEFIKQVNDIGVSIIGQTKNLAPADKLLYSLRDVTGTVNSIPLISSSIMSKKIASGADAIVLDVKIGSGAFMKTLDDAKILAKTMVDIGNGAGRDTTAVITSMKEPLGYNIGNSLEVIEAIETLKGNGPSDLIELITELGTQMLLHSKICTDKNEAKKLLLENINNGKGLKKLREFIKYQGGDERIIDDYNLFKQPKVIKEIKSLKSGYVSQINALEIGIMAMELGAGRRTKNDTIDLSAGIVLNKKIGDYIEKNETLLSIYTDIDDFADTEKNLINAFSIISEKVSKPQLIYAVI